MCGIIGYAGHRPAVPILLRALKDLEYRGYDSAGIAVLDGNSLAITKKQGKIANLEQALGPAPAGTVGIGHTRWATHGRPSDQNAHPHASCDGRVVVIHNGIVENYASLREELAARGHTFRSETDTETVAHLIEEEVRAGADIFEALRRAAGRVEGSQAIVAMSLDEPGTLAAARLGNAGGVVIGFGPDETVVASDLAAVLPITQEVAFLADGQVARITAAGAEAKTVTGDPVALQRKRIPIDPVTALKGQYPHFMLKEIHEQPEAIADTIWSLATLDPPALYFDDLGPAAERLASIERVVLIGMGTSLHAAMIGQRYIEAFARVPAWSDNASEFRYRDPVLDDRTLVISVSQSGETVDVLEAMAVARQAGALQITICNTEGAQTTRVADGTVYTRAGLERGVASTKCFTAAVVALYLLALRIAQAKGRLSQGDLAAHLAELAHLPRAVAGIIAQRDAFRKTALRHAQAQHVLFLGRGLAFPVAMEGALKLKEVSYIHAEGYAAGEMKHGPIALIEPAFPTIAIATRHALRAKMVSNIEQIQARGGPVTGIVTEGDAELASLCDAVIAVPAVSSWLEPVAAVIPLQLLAYDVAVHRGCDVDQPRNLAKTVTVE
ncbi:glutamine--fructose-6-phosphate transaminase (isomerizing) [Tepidiforma sp.]|uniref:glutamine--fructose-6-phosphate transaminase (isomerizing) n=1 Tax=Tepidiforma sp. TaxID=2682230 RepID=UPI002613814C|nr:glutamine--fructose-6-phosphate transaminase (isomerizing) [Tepidiforma sp.]MCX7616904.1 glutamine--fructose-6-phosphate transaminase (isomerizing) [Tepidiforma sp.]